MVFVKVLFALKLTFLVTSCSSVSRLYMESPLDLEFNILKVNQGQKQISPGVYFYQMAIGPVLGSHCQWYPSDSSNAQMIYKRCGGLKMVPMAMARFITEPNAAQMGFKSVLIGDQIRFENLLKSCTFF